MLRRIAAPILSRLKADEADSGAVTLIQRFGSAANLNIHLHCLVLDGVLSGVNYPGRRPR